jgi:hypothetical protein
VEFVGSSLFVHFIERILLVETLETLRGTEWRRGKSQSKRRVQSKSSFISFHM